MVRALGPELAARLDPDLPGRQPDRHPGSLVGRRARRSSSRSTPCAARSGLAAEASGSNNWAVSRRAQRHRLAADRRRPAPAAEHAGHLVPGRPQRSATASSAAPRCRACPASTWARTTTSAGPSPTSWPTSRTSSSSGSRATATCSRTSGGRWRSCARRSPVKGRDAPEVLDVRDHPPRPDRQRGARRRRGRAARAALADARPADRLPGHVRAARDRLRARAGRQARGPQLARLEPDLGRPPRLDRLQADRPPAAAQGRLPRPAEAGLDGRVRVGGDDPLRRAAGDGRPRERLPRHRQQPHRRRRVPAPHHQRVARRLPRRADRAAAARRATSTTSRASRRCSPTTSRCRGSRRRGGWAG